MNESVKKIIDQMRGVWKEMNFSARFMSSVLLLGAVIGFGFWISFMQKEEYGMLYSGKDTKEVGQIVNYLRDNDLPFRLKDAGKTVYIPVERIYETRLNLSTEGLMQGKTGFEMFDEVKFGVTSFAQKVNYRRALQGELARTISQLEPVDSASVQVVIPDESLFIEEEKTTTASIVLKLKAGRYLSQQQVSGIVQLVSSGVEGLKPNNVTITDSGGNLLTVKESSSMISKNNEQLDLQKRIEEYYVQKAREIVYRVLGTGRAVVKVSADMEYKNVEEKHVIYDPDRKVPKTQRVVTRVSGGPSRSGGVPGADSNIRQVGLVQEVGTQNEEETIQTEYDTSRVERLVSKNAGVLQKLSVAILVDGNYETVEEDGEELRKYIPLSQATLNHLGSLVKNALGISETRGDSVDIKNLQFREEEPEEVVAKKNPIVQILMDNVALLVTLVSFLMFAMIVLKKMKSRVELLKEAPADLKKMTRLTRDERLKEKLAAEGIEMAEDADQDKLVDEVDEAMAQKKYEGIKEGMIKSAAMKELIQKPGKEINEDLEIFKIDVQKTVSKKVDAAAVILKKWLSQ